ncbi:hypothetical protein QCA50_007292 [Cerrena zonata]|uniref:Uncharacterized protein n=1 Tax=Cerrena zonata TaxID=2478898 RepID=A0AAW0GK70_9APHY
MSTRRSASIQPAKDGNSVLFARHPTTNESRLNDLDSQPMLPRIDNEDANRLSTSRSPTDSATDTDAPLVIVSSGRRAISLKLILPTLLVIVGTAGMATLLLLWLLLHRIQNNNVWKDRAFLLNEGVKLEGGHEAARLLGLTIISAASKVVSCVTPALIFLYSFYLARFWLSQRDTYRGGSNLPTPLQCVFSCCI